MTSQRGIFDKLPGQEVPVGKALAALSEMWDAQAGEGAAPSEFRASRMTLVLHLGFDCTEDEANDVFESVLDFSRRYPCRVIVLCAHPDSWESDAGMACKIYSQCYIGPSRQDMSCCEALVLGYTLKSREYLENQVSNFVEADLPVYYLPFRFDSPERLSDYQYFFKESKRILLDTSKERFLLDQVDIPDRAKVHDLASARLLPVRQCIGQFLSAFPVEAIASDLDEVILTSGAEFKAEGRALLSWIGEAMNACFERPGVKTREAGFSQHTVDTDCATPRLVFTYANNNSFECVLDFEKSEAYIEASFGGEKQSVTAAVSMLDLQSALSEGLFFG
ncbi:MAG: glucose-6-phosphate dehydrogenase assembly protein OpcA [Verrucomicrobiota bacterium]